MIHCDELTCTVGFGMTNAVTPVARAVHEAFVQEADTLGALASVPVFVRAEVAVRVRRLARNKLGKNAVERVKVNCNNRRKHA